MAAVLNTGVEGQALEHALSEAVARCGIDAMALATVFPRARGQAREAVVDVVQRRLDGADRTCGSRLETGGALGHTIDAGQPLRAIRRDIRLTIFALAHQK